MVTEARKKLDPKATPAVLVGYDTDCKAYRLHNPLTKRTFHSQDVRFVEDKFPFLSTSPSTPLVAPSSTAFAPSSPSPGRHARL
jgi:hypothetical protein